jgi:hypothetical protein
VLKRLVAGPLDVSELDGEALAALVKDGLAVVDGDIAALPV